MKTKRAQERRLSKELVKEIQEQYWAKNKLVEINWKRLKIRRDRKGKKKKKGSQKGSQKGGGEIRRLKKRRKQNGKEKKK